MYLNNGIYKSSFRTINESYIYRHVVAFGIIKRSVGIFSRAGEYCYVHIFINRSYLCLWNTMENGQVSGVVRGTMWIEMSV